MLEKATHICLIGVAIVSMVLLVERRFSHHGRVAPAANALLGKHLTVSGASFRRSGVTAALFISTQCHFCRESVSFYRQLSEARRQSTASVKLSVLSVEPVDEMKTFLSGELLSVDEVYAAPSETALRGTPTLLILDSAGVVRRVFAGKLDSSREQEVVRIFMTGRIV